MAEAVAQLESVLQLASAQTTEAQARVTEALSQAQQLPEYKLYLLAIFVGVGKDVHVRQRAGLLLKNLLNQQSFENITQEQLVYLKEKSLQSTQDSCKEVRETSGTIISVIIQKLGGIEHWEAAPTTLINNLDHQQLDVVDGAFSALKKILEDFVQSFTKQWEDNWFDQNSEEEIPPFIYYSSKTLIPKLLQKANRQQPLIVKRYAIELLNMYATNHILDHQTYQNLIYEFAQPYMQVIGDLAQDDDPEILADVCRGMCHLASYHHQMLAPNITDVVQHMMKFSEHPVPSTKLQALEFWSQGCQHQDFYKPLLNILPNLVPLILKSMRYADEDYLSMNAVNEEADVPDRPQDMAHKFSKSNKRQVEPDEDGGGAPWGQEWTCRKAAATALDTLSNVYQTNLLNVVLPLIEQNLTREDDWEAQESGVLALGAIAYGCMDGLKQFLSQILELLIKTSDSQKPLLRSICVWCISRYSDWICRESSSSPEKKNILTVTLRAILMRVLDRNKRVQEAACSAFATLEEEARTLLVPYLHDIIQTLKQAFSMYQANNLLNLYDVCGTLAESVGHNLAKPELLEPYMEPLMVCLQITNPQDRPMVPLLNCFSQITHIGPGLMPYCVTIVDKCGTVIQEYRELSNLHKRDPQNHEKPQLDPMSAAIDLLAGLVDGMDGRLQEILNQRNFINVLKETLKEQDIPVKQSSFAMMGELGRHAGPALTTHLDYLLPAAAESLLDQSPNVSNNASWAIGEVCVSVPQELVRPHLERIVHNLVLQFDQAYKMQRHLLQQNACITIGRLGLVFGAEMAKILPHILERWCNIMKEYRLDEEKKTAFIGFCNMIKSAGNETCVTDQSNALLILNTLGSVIPNPSLPNSSLPDQLVNGISQIIQGYKGLFGEQWNSAVHLLRYDAVINLRAIDPTIPIVNPHPQVMTPIPRPLPIAR